jgi:5,10-methenyltetrahydrofolate synthetase
VTREEFRDAVVAAILQSQGEPEVLGPREQRVRPEAGGGTLELRPLAAGEGIARGEEGGILGMRRPRLRHAGEQDRQQQEKALPRQGFGYHLFRLAQAFAPSMTDQPPDSAVNSAAWRAALRREKIAARLALPAEVHSAASARILARLADLLADRPPATLGFCRPIRAEVDCLPLVERLLAAGWQAVVPTVTAVEAPMTFRIWWPGAPLTVDPYGIPVPDTAAGRVPDVLLVPLVAFDAAGYRLGYGGGYFDRTLAACRPRPLSIGVGFACAEVESIHPGEHDIPLDAVITENSYKSFKFGQSS